MATRMQQRRGTATQWTTANPILAAGEIGFESNTSKFKIGDGVNHWADLDYFANYSAIESLIDGAPDALNTLNEIAAAIGDNENFSEAVADAVELAITTAVAGANEHSDDMLLLHTDSTTNVHGILDTAELSTISYTDTRKQEAIDAAAIDATTKANAAQSAAEDYADGLANNYDPAGTATSAVSTHNSDTTDVHGITNTADLATKTYADNSSTTAVSDHNSDTTSVHGIADTSVLETTTGSQNKADAALDAAETYADSAVSTAVAALTKSSVGLGNVDNTADADKPVSTATQTALDAKASLAGATFTGNVEMDGNLVVDGDFTVNGTNFSASATSITIEDNMVQLAHQNAANTVDLGLVVGYNDGAAKHSGIVRDVSADKWKLFKGVTTEPSTTVDFTQGSLDALQVGALEATTVTPSSGIVFSDGTQTKLGVPSVTTFATEISSSATLAAGEADKFVPLTGAVTITLPATGYSTGQSIDFYQASGTGAQFASTNSVVGTPGLKFRTTNSVVTAMKTSSGWLVFGDLSA